MLFSQWPYGEFTVIFTQNQIKFTEFAGNTSGLYIITFAVCARCEHRWPRVVGQVTCVMIYLCLAQGVALLEAVALLE